MGEIKMSRYGLVIDCNKCIGCYNCFLSCQDEFCGNVYPGYAAAAPMAGHNWMRVLDKERGQYPKVKVTYTPKTCMHCEDAQCISAAQDNAVYRRPDGIVIIDPEKAKGQKHLVNACPYRVIEWNEEAGLPQKCIMCAHLLDSGVAEPRCVESCPTQALVFGDLDNPQSEISQMLAQEPVDPLCSEFNLNEKVLYRGLPKRFVSGTVVYQDKCRCAENVQVEIDGNSGKRRVTTNGFGDFEFEGLEANQSFFIKISQTGYKEQCVQVDTFADIYMGEIFLQPLP